VLRDGKIVMRETRDQFARPAVVSAMVGREIVTRVRERGEQDLTANKKMLAVTNLTLEPYFRDISFVLREGEILGLGGLVGSGRTEIAETIYGLRSAERGRVEVEGVALAHRTPRDCVDAGLIYLPEDRGRHGIFAEVEVTRNVTAGVIHRLPRRGPLLRPAAERRMAEEATKTTAVRMPTIDALMKTLSGGNQQRSMLARWLLAEPKVAIFDEPTRGVDIGAKDDIWTLVIKLAHEGLACLLISSELTELTMICDRVLAIYEGSVVGELTGDDITDARLGAMVVGPVAR
jgi:ABC-type sugar transport system ATPase subunit